MAGGFPSAALGPDDFAASIANPYPEPDWLKQVQGGGTGMMVPGIVDYDAANSLSEALIVEQIKKNITASKEARSHRIDEWRFFSDLYQNRQVTTNKAAWQADVFIPEVWNAVEGMKGMVQAALLDSAKWFTLEEYPDWNEDFSKVPFIEKVVAYALDKADFVSEYLKAFEESLICGSGCLRLSWRTWIERGPRIVDVPVFTDMQQMLMAQQMGMPTTRGTVMVQPRLRSCLEAKQVPLLACFPDPYAVKFGQRFMRFFAERMTEDDDQVKEGVRSGRYDSSKDIGEPVAFDLETELRGDETDLADTGSKAQRKRHLIDVYHGNLYAQDGRLACENWRVVVANERKILAVSPNPLYRGTFPYVWVSPLPRRGTLWGRSLVEAAASMQVEVNKLFNLMIDSNFFAVLPAGMVDEDKLDEPIDVDSITPGQLYRGKPDAITPFKLSSAPNDAWPMIQAIEQKIQLATMYNEFQMGAPTAKGRPTAYEVQTKSSAGQQQVNVLAKRIERSDLVPAVQIAYEHCLQYLSDTTDPELQAILREWGGSPNLADPIERYRLLDANFRVRAGGVSQLLSRNDTMNAQMQMLQLGAQLGIPPQPQVKLYYSIMRTLGLDPRSFGEPASPEEMMAFIQQMMAQQQAAASGGGQGGDSLNSAPPPPSLPTSPPQPNSPEELATQVRTMGPPMAPGA